MFTIQGNLGKANVHIVFVCQKTTTECVKFATANHFTKSDGSYNFQVYEGVYNVSVDGRVYKLITVDKSGSLNDILGAANAYHM